MQRPQGPPVGGPATAPSLPGREFLLARLQRAQAVPAAQRTPEVAAFVEAMQLEEEACALLPLVRPPPGSAAGAPPATEATAQRLAILLMIRMMYVCGDTTPPLYEVGYHLCAYMARGCGSLYPPFARTITELPALLRRSGGTNALGAYLWSYAEAHIHPLASILDQARALAGAWRSAG